LKVLKRAFPVEGLRPTTASALWSCALLANPPGGGEAVLVRQRRVEGLLGNCFVWLFPVVAWRGASLTPHFRAKLVFKKYEKEGVPLSPHPGTKWSFLALGSPKSLGK
jgi:hypothetical protein